MELDRVLKDYINCFSLISILLIELQTAEDLERQAHLAGVDIATRAYFSNDPEPAIRQLKREDARIIVGLFYEDAARLVFCEVAR